MKPAATAPLVFAILGPTAVGKTAVGIELASRLRGEIISADSRQIYRQLDIGTAKPTIEERQQIKHHFVDELDLSESFSAGRFASEARNRIREIQRTSALPIVVGGSTLYVHALLYGLADIPPIPDDIRQRVQAEMDRMGPEALKAKLRDVDPAGAAQIDVSNARRVQRMMEVWYATDRPLSSFWAGEATSPLPAVGYVLNMDRTVLYDRINRRVDIMFDAGLMQEVASILEEGYDPDLPPLRTIGYQECIPCLRGEISRAEARRLVARNTRRYAKRQLTWLRRYKGLKWLDIGPDDGPVRIADRIIEDRTS